MNMAVDPNQAPGLAPAALQLSGITRSFDEGNRELHILNGADTKFFVDSIMHVKAVGRNQRPYGDDAQTRADRNEQRIVFSVCDRRTK